MSRLLATLLALSLFACSGGADDALARRVDAVLKQSPPGTEVYYPGEEYPSLSGEARTVPEGMLMVHYPEHREPSDEDKVAWWLHPGHGVSYENVVPRFEIFRFYWDWQESFPPGVTTAFVEGAVLDGMTNFWSRQPTFSFCSPGYCGMPYWATNLYIRNDSVGGAGGDYGTGGCNFAATTILPLEDGPLKLGCYEAEISLNLESIQSAYSASYFEKAIEVVSAHEFGHVAGLGHRSGNGIFACSNGVCLDGTGAPNMMRDGIPGSLQTQTLSLCHWNILASFSSGTLPASYVTPIGTFPCSS